MIPIAAVKIQRPVSLVPLSDTDKYPSFICRVISALSATSDAWVMMITH